MNWQFQLSWKGVSSGAGDLFCKPFFKALHGPFSGKSVFSSALLVDSYKIRCFDLKQILIHGSCSKVRLVQKERVVDV